MDYSKKTLGELLSHSNDTIKRNAISILKQLQKDTESIEIARHERQHLKIQRWGEQHPDFHTKEHMEWLKKNQ